MNNFVERIRLIIEEHISGEKVYTVLGTKIISGIVKNVMVSRTGDFFILLKKKKNEESAENRVFRIIDVYQTEEEAQEALRAKNLGIFIN